MAEITPMERTTMDFAKARSAQTNGITMEFFEQGEGSAVLLLHGFPELPFSWRLQANAVAEAGFRVIIPSQRGYGGTDAPSGPYDVKTLVADLTGLLDHLEVADAVWFGHDFGAQPAWFSAHFAPDRVLGMGSLCVPYPLVQGDLRTGRTARQAARYEELHAGFPGAGSGGERP